MKPTLNVLQAVDVAYARYNARKTFSDARASQFVSQQVGPFVMTQDATRSDSYYNRILGVTRYNIGRLPQAISQFSPLPHSLRVDVVAAEAPVVEEQLHQLEFQQSETVLWLWAHPTERPLSVAVQLLLPDQIDRLRPLFETKRPLDNSLWDARKRYLSTAELQTFVIEADGLLVAMASIFLRGETAVLGNAFTLPAYRGRGYQQALLQARLNDVYQRQINLAWVDVEADTSSDRNCRRIGFKPFVEIEAWEFQSA
ncbi:MAG: GNAT family N-acetyltransferase [Anaerolineales bacterium]|nr:GNAT family N-acetyltransferase [Anaerolineales bacterium]